VISEVLVDSRIQFGCLGVRVLAHDAEDGGHAGFKNGDTLNGRVALLADFVALLLAALKAGVHDAWLRLVADPMTE
jgi:hypothetical protein